MGCGASVPKKIGDVGDSVKAAGMTAALDVGGAVGGITDPQAVMNARSNTEWYRGDACCDECDWMAKVPDDKNVSEMFIPGTHDTMADEGGDLAECQSWSLQKQLESGVRGLDIRLKHDGDSLLCFHGIVDLHKDVNEVVSTCEAFLTAHPKEAIFMRVKKEGEDGTHEATFDALFHKFLTKPELWDFKESGFHDLATHRGKVCTIALASSLELYQQPLDVQDHYNTGDADEKCGKIMEHATKERPAGTMFVNFTSCVGKDGAMCFKAPGSIAYEVNKKVMDAKDQLKPGMYLMDFPGNKLIKDIIGLNGI